MPPAVIAFSRITWGGMYNTVEPRLAGLAARGWRIVHSNGALSVWDRGGDQWNSAGWRSSVEGLGGVMLDRPGRWLPRWPKWQPWDRWAMAHHARRLRRATGQPRDTPVTGYLFHPEFFPYVKALEPVRVVFQVIDNFAFQPGWTARAQRELEALVERADLILANNDSQASLLPGTGPARARVIGNAVDLPRIEAGWSAPCPADLAAIPTPRIGYVGMLNAKIDFAMIAHVAAARPEWHWVLIGPARWPENGEYPDIAEDWRRCQQRPNVHFLGFRPREDVAAYLAWMQVNTLCYRLSAGPWTRAAYPFKVLECLAAGPPVVSSPMPEVLRHGGLIEFAESPAEWIAAISRALGDGGAESREARIEVARANSWEARIGELDRLFAEVAMGPSQRNGTRDPASCTRTNS